MQTLEERSGRQPNYIHVKAHEGDAYNEFVDVLAYDALQRGILQTPLDFDVRSVLQEENPTCAHWPLLARTTFPRTNMPKCSQGHIGWSYPKTQPDPQIVWKDLVQVEEQPPNGACLQLRCVTYNVRSLKEDGQLMGLGITAFLRSQLEGRHYDIVFLQETRARQSCIQETADYRRFISASTPQGHGGTEIWLSKNTRWVPNNVLKWKMPLEAVILHSTPECLIIHFGLHGRKLVLISAHAPHGGKSREEVQQWWDAMDGWLGRHVGQSALIMGIDANAHFNETTEGCVGAAGLEERQNYPATQMVQCLSRWSMWIPSTYENIHFGPHGTWYNPHLEKWHRCDYLVLSGNFFDDLLKTWVDGNLDTGGGSMDHVPVALQLDAHWQVKTDGNLPKKRHIDVLALKAATPQQVEKALQRSVDISWDSDIHEHGARFVEQIRNDVAEAFPAQCKGPYRDYITKETWGLRGQRRTLRKHLYQRRQRCRGIDVCAAFTAWKEGRSLKTCMANGKGWYIKALLRDIHDKLLLRKTGREVKRRLRADRDQYCQQVAEQAASLPPSIVLQKMRCIGVMGKSKRREMKPLCNVTAADGTLLTDEEAINDRWRQHFEELEDGVACDKEHLLEQCIDAQRRRTRVMPQWGEIPTILDVEESFRLNKTGRAAFYDGIPTDLCHLFPQVMAKVYYGLALKQTLQVAEPLSLKGGVLIHAYKGRGSASDCGSYRSLMVSSVLSKSLHRILRTKCMKYFKNASMPLQIGGLPGKSVSQGAHALISFASACRRRNAAMGILFIDIRQAFYRLVRQHIVHDGDIDQSTIRLFQTLDLPHEAFHEFAVELASEPALAATGVSTFLEQHVAECLNSTWFRLKHSGQVSLTRKGSRPGDNLADLLFTFAFKKIMRRIIDVIEKEGISMSFTGCGEIHPFPLQLEAQYCTQFSTLGPVWADDLAILVTTMDAMELLPKVRVIAATVIDMLAVYGMQVNCDRGKSELVVDIRGRGSHEVKRELFRHKPPCVDVQTRHGGQIFLHVVPKYKHLGTLFAAKGSMVPEVKQRVGQARAEFQRYRRQIYANGVLPHKTRIDLFNSLVLSGLCFNIAVWPVLKKQEYENFRSGLHGLYASLAYNLWGEEVYEWRDEQITSKLQLPDATTLMIIARLRYLQHLMVKGDEYIWAFIHFDGSWLGLIAHDLLWLQRNCCRAVPTVDPRDEWDPWEKLITDRGLWRSILKRATTHSLLQTQKRVEWYSWHRQILLLLRDHQLWSDVKTVANNTMHGCLRCGLRFATKAAWSVHCFKTTWAFDTGPLRSLG